MKGYKEQRKKAQDMYLERKNELVNSAKEQTRREKLRNRLKKLAEEKKANNPTDPVVKNEQKEPQEESLKTRTKEQIQEELKQLEDLEKQFNESHAELTKRKQALANEIDK